MRMEKINQNLNTLAINAVRYALGRKSYVTDEVARAVWNELDGLTIHTVKQIWKDIHKAIKDDDYGMEMDKQIWLGLANEIESALGDILYK